jgi:hypothetical protein
MGAAKTAPERARAVKTEAMIRTMFKLERERRFVFKSAEKKNVKEQRLALCWSSQR